MTSPFGRRKHVYCTSSRKIHLRCAQDCVLWSPWRSPKLCRHAGSGTGESGGCHECQVHYARLQRLFSYLNLVLLPCLHHLSSKPCIVKREEAGIKRH